MAVPELGQIRIIPDFFNYQLAISNTLTSLSETVNDSIYNCLDHRGANKTTWDTNTDDPSLFYLRSDGYFTHTGWMIYMSDHNLGTSYGRVGWMDSTTSAVTSGTFSKVLGDGAISGGYFDPSVDTPIVMTIDESKAMRGVWFQDRSSGGWNGDLAVGILHMGAIFEMPTNAQASLSYNTKYQNKVNTAFSGASYSTLYNTNPQRIIKASWEYINWATGSSGVDDFTTMMNQCYGSHIPVALQLSQTGTITSDYFMFARITNWNQTQMSPTLWKVSAEFTEFI